MFTRNKIGPAAKTGYLCIALSLSGCGLINYGQTSAPNDPVPKGSPVCTGQFFPQNGASPASGSVQIYSAGVGAYVLRLQGVSFPSNNGMTIQIQLGNGQTNTLQLRAVSGSQNYDITSNASFTTVTIYSPSSNPPQSVAQAQLTCS